MIIILSINSHSQTQQDTLTIFELSQDYLKDDYSEMGLSSQLAYECSGILDCNYLIKNGIRILSENELFNEGYCIWYKLIALEISNDNARIEVLREVCNDNFEKRKFVIFFKKIDNHWVIK